MNDKMLCYFMKSLFPLYDVATISHNKFMNEYIKIP